MYIYYFNLIWKKKKKKINYFFNKNVKGNENENYTSIELINSLLDRLIVKNETLEFDI